jgi:hypothetical protein
MVRWPLSAICAWLNDQAQSFDNTNPTKQHAGHLICTCALQVSLALDRPWSDAVGDGDDGTTLTSRSRRSCAEEASRHREKEFVLAVPSGEPRAVMLWVSSPSCAL